MSRPARLAFACCAALAASPAHGAAGKELARIDALVAKHRYLSAARAIQDAPALRSQPRFLRSLSHILVTYYAVNINFRIFSLADLAQGQDLEAIRRTPGQYTVVGADWERALRDALAAHPLDPDVQFAVGEYLSRAQTCGCAKLEVFTGSMADEFPYLEAAYRGGVHDSWSLFRMGVHHMGGEKPDFRAAAELFEASLKEDPGRLPVHYEAAVAYFRLKELEPARTHALATAGRNHDRKLDADAYEMLGRIELTAGRSAAAEKALRTALELRPEHEAAFMALLHQLRTEERFADYKKVAAAYVALDYANTYPFGVYLGYLRRVGLVDADRELGRELAARKYERPEEIGATFYSLGILAELDSDKALAHERYRRSLEALRREASPPKESIETLTELVRRTGPG
jgi:tetratricopeptide (TPR) repeat protein